MARKNVGKGFIDSPEKHHKTRSGSGNKEAEQREIKNLIKTEKRMTIEEVLQHDLRFRYMLLSRLQADCEYYLGFGNRNSGRLWAGSEAKQIEYMIKIHDSFGEVEKPEWLTMERIKEYSRQMGVTEK